MVDDGLLWMLVDRSSPLPDNLEAALKEIETLRNILHRERETLAKKVEQRELDKKSHRGHIRQLQDEIEELKAQVASYQKRLGLE